MAKEFVACTFMEAMQALNDGKCIRLTTLTRGDYMKIDSRGKVWLYGIRDQIVHPGIAIMRLDDSWMMETP